MNDLDSFLASTLPTLRAAETALHNGYASQRIAMWSRNDPVTLFGAAFTGSGWAEVRPIFDLLGTRFSNCTSSDFQLIGAAAAGISPTSSASSTSRRRWPAPHRLPTRCGRPRSFAARTASGRSSTATAIRTIPRQDSSPPECGSPVHRDEPKGT